MAFTVRGRGEINVTPLIDVLLVLLVIFLIVMPVGVKFEPLAMPPKHEPHIDPEPHLIVKVHADLSVTLIDEHLETDLQAPEMAAGLRAHLRDTHHVVFVEMPDDMPWDHVVSTIDTIHGVAPSTTQVALVMEP